MPGKVPTVIIEAIYDGLPGCYDNITVLQASTVNAMMNSSTLPRAVKFVNIRKFWSKSHLLANGIHPKAALFVHSIANQNTKLEPFYVCMQLGRREDFEREFGVLRSKIHIIAPPHRLWRLGKMKTIILCCVIMHNTILEERRPIKGDFI